MTETTKNVHNLWIMLAFVCSGYRSVSIYVHVAVKLTTDLEKKNVIEKISHSIFGKCT